MNTQGASPNQFPQNHYFRPNQPKVCRHHGSQSATDAGDKCCPMHNLDQTVDALAEMINDGLNDDGFNPKKFNESEFNAGEQKENGGSSKIGELDSQCKPTLSLRSKRKRFTWMCTGFTIGLLLISFSVPGGNTIIAPGVLCSKHAQLMGENANRCAACHSAGDKGFLAWAGSLFSGQQSLGPTQSELCLKCHEQMLSGGLVNKSNSPFIHTQNAHGLPAETLDALTQNHTNNHNRSFLASFASSPYENGGKIACSTCHKEHQGANSDLTALSDSQCQTCHQNRFASLSSGHPEFTKYPHERRTRIAFDHSTHFGNHFPGKNTTFDCNQCHVDDEYQDVKRLASFEQSCAQCHDQSIRDSVYRGIELINLPMLDLAFLTKAGINVGYWPESANGDFDGKIPDVAKLLLQSDPNAVSAFANLGAEFEFLDIDTDNRRQLKSVEQLIWALKRLLHELATDCDATVKRRLQFALNDDKSDYKVIAFANQFDPLTLRRAVSRWLPELERELSIYDARTGDNLQFLNSRLKGQMASSQKTTQDEVDLLAKNPLRELLNSNAPVSGITSTGDGGSSSSNLTPAAPNESPLPSAPVVNGISNVEIIKNQFLNQDSIDPDRLLAENPLPKLLNSKTDPSQMANLTEGQKDPVESFPANPTFPRHSTQPQTNSSEVIRMARLLQTANQSKSGYWIEDNQTLSISYQPSGHSDQFIRALFDVITHNASNPTTRDLLDKRLKPTATGLCASCHTVDEIIDNRLIVNWQSQTRDPSIRQFTRFSHRPHLIQPQTSDCTSCHEMDLNKDIRENFVGFDSRNGLSNFRAMTKADCMGCHQKGRASSSCSTCHSYHVGSKVISRIK